MSAATSSIPPTADVSPETPANLTPAAMQEIREELANSPSERDLEIHAIVHEEGLTQREAAGRFQLSQPRICKILQAVDDWSANLGFDYRGKRSPDERRRLAEHIYRQRLDYFYSRAMRAWENSQGDHSTSRTLLNGQGAPQAVTRSFRAHGTPAYLMLALRIAERIARLDGVETGGPRRRRESEIRLSSSPESFANPSGSAPAQTSTTAEVAAKAEPPQASSRHSNILYKEVINRPRQPGASEKPLTQGELDAIFERMLADHQQMAG